MTKQQVLKSEFSPHEKWVKKDFTSLKDWPFSFEIKFYERSFVLNARSRQEMLEWVRVFNLILRMNKIGHSLGQQNPYDFEQKENSLNNEDETPKLR